MKIINIEKVAFFVQIYRSSGPSRSTVTTRMPFYRATVDKLPEGVRSIVVASDIQGRENSPENRLAGVTTAEILARMVIDDYLPPIDLAILCGDLFDHEHLSKMSGWGPSRPVWEAFSAHFPRVLGVHGNHDEVADGELDHLVSTQILHGTRITVGKTSFGGVSGVMAVKSRKSQRYAPADQLARIKRVADCSCIILHQGPEGSDALQIGDESVSQALQKGGSGLVLFGHCHWPVHLMIAKVGGHQVLNCDNRVICITER